MISKGRGSRRGAREGVLLLGGTLLGAGVLGVALLGAALLEVLSLGDALDESGGELDVAVFAHREAPVNGRPWRVVTAG